MAENKKITMDYRKMSIEDMVLYIRDYDPTEKSKEFIRGFYEEKPKNTKSVNKLDATGKPVTYVDKKGRIKIRKQKVAVGNETKQVYNILKAKKGFYNRYKDVIEFKNPPKDKKKENKSTKIEKALALLD